MTATTKPTVRPPAEECCPTCLRPLVMAVPCTHHEAPAPASALDVVDRAVVFARVLRVAGRTDDAQLLGELIGALRYARATIDELKPQISAVKFRQACGRASR